VPLTSVSDFDGVDNWVAVEDWLFIKPLKSSFHDAEVDSGSELLHTQETSEKLKYQFLEKRTRKEEKQKEERTKKNWTREEESFLLCSFNEKRNCHTKAPRLDTKTCRHCRAQSCRLSHELLSSSAGSSFPSLFQFRFSFDCELISNHNKRQ
jgi:hypothetical protein